MKTPRFLLAPAAHPRAQEVLDRLVASVGGCRAAVVAEYAEDTGFLAIASRGLGADAPRTLLGRDGGIVMLEAAVEHRCWVTQSGDGVVWKPDPEKLHRATARALQARTRLVTGVASPIVLNDVVLGVIALYGGKSGLGSAEHRAATRAAAAALASSLERGSR